MLISIHVHRPLINYTYVMRCVVPWHTAPGDDVILKGIVPVTRDKDDYVCRSILSQ